MAPRAERRRVLALHFSSPSEALEFLEYLLRIGVGGVEGSELKGATLKIILSSAPEAADETVSRLVEEVGRWRASRRPSGAGVYRHNVRMLLSTVPLEVGIPVNALVDILGLRGFKARLEGGDLVTSADREALTALLKAFAARYAEALKLNATHTLKRLAAVTATALSIDLGGALSLLQDLGLARLEGGRWVLAVNYGDALKILMERGPATQ